MAKFIVTIDTDNAAFEGGFLGHEIGLILRTIADNTERGISPKRYFTVPVRDTNGNTVGKYVFTK
jgi:hypothetical protein